MERMTAMENMLAESMGRLECNLCTFEFITARDNYQLYCEALARMLLQSREIMEEGGAK